MKTNRLFWAACFAAVLTLSACGGKEQPAEGGKEQEEPGDKPAEYTITAEEGWDIYTAGTYRYGPSIIINDDGSIDAWFAAAGSTYAEDFGKRLASSENHTPLFLANTAVGLAFTSKEPFCSLQACCPTWGTNGTEAMTMALYRWEDSYEKTLQGEPLLHRRVTEMQDNAWNMLAKEDGKVPAGRYLLLLNEGTSKAGVWFAPRTLDLPEYELQGYQNGAPVEGAPEVILMLEKAEDINGTYWDQVSYQHSTDGGRTWTPEEMVLKPTHGSRDELSCCDPGAIKIGDYYYLGYTSTEHTGGLENHLYMARSKSPRGPWEKWNGEGWGGSNVQPIVTYTGAKEKWGVGEPSMVVVDGTLYVYYSWNETVETTRVSTAPADDPLWPAKLTHHGTAINKQGLTGADHCDVKYCDEMQKFIAVHTAQRMSKSSFIQIWTSTDGKTFQKYKKLTGRLGGGLHNIGISGDAQGHIDVNKQQFIAYAYGLDEQGNSSWGRWNTKWNPLKITKK